jgi:hypothetical protein
MLSTYQPVLVVAKSCSEACRVKRADRSEERVLPGGQHLATLLLTAPKDCSRQSSPPRGWDRSRGKGGDLVEMNGNASDSRSGMRKHERPSMS